MVRRHLLVVLTAATWMTAACGAATAPPVRDPSPRPPEGCSRDFPASAPMLELDATRAPASSPRKGQPLQFANTIAVNRELAGEGEWTDFDDGWSSLALRLRSPGARTLSVHLTAATLPARTQVWICSADGRVRQGPYREATGGELWTPVVPGDEARLEVIVPTRDKAAFSAILAEAYGGFR